MPKLNETKLKEIEQQIKSGKKNIEIAKKYNVSAQYIGRLKKSYSNDNVKVINDKVNDKSDEDEDEDDDEEEDNVSLATTVSDNTPEPESESESEQEEDKTPEPEPEPESDQEELFESDVIKKCEEDDKKKDPVKPEKKGKIDLNELNELMNSDYPLKSNKDDSMGNSGPTKRGGVRKATVSKKHVSLSKKELQNLRGIRPVVPKTKLSKEERAEMKKQEKEEKALEDDKKQKLIFKLSKFAEKYPSNILILSSFGKDPDVR